MAFVLYMPSLIVTQLGPYISRVLCFHLAASLPRRPSRSMLCCLFFFRNPLAHSGVRARGPTSLRCSRRDPATISAATWTTIEAAKTREGRPISCGMPLDTGSGLPVDVLGTQALIPCRLPVTYCLPNPEVVVYRGKLEHGSRRRGGHNPQTNWEWTCSISGEEED